MNKIIYRESDGTIIDTLESNASISGLANGLRLGSGEYAGTETNISQVSNFAPEVIYIPVRTIVERLTAIGKATTVWNSLSVEQQLNFITLEEGVDINDSTVRTLLSSLDIDPDSILY